jgi:hypothetical protein
MNELKEENIRNVKVPLSVDQIKEFFTNKDLLYLVNYKNSDLKGVVFLTYLSNLDLPAEINFTGSSYEEKEALFKIYMETRNILSSETLRLNTARILLEYRNIATKDMYMNPCFDDAEVKKFHSNHSELLDKWEQFVESTTIYAQSTVEPLTDAIKIEDTIEAVEDQQFIGANVVNLFSIPSFYETFLTVPFRKDLKYFKHQFEDYMFRGKNFFSYFNCEENLVYKMFMAHVNGEINLKLIADAELEANVKSDLLDY